MIDLYKERKYVEELDYIQGELEGVDSMLDGLKTSLEEGISADSLDGRNEAFGTHKKEAPVRTGFCTMLKEALDDFKDGEYELSGNATAVIIEKGKSKTIKFQDGIGVATMPKAGAMVGVSVAGQRFGFTEK